MKIKNFLIKGSLARKIFIIIMLLILLPLTILQISRVTINYYQNIETSKKVSFLIAETSKHDINEYFKTRYTELDNLRNRKIFINNTVDLKDENEIANIINSNFGKDNYLNVLFFNNDLDNIYSLNSEKTNYKNFKLDTLQNSSYVLEKVNYAINANEIVLINSKDNNEPLIMYCVPIFIEDKNVGFFLAILKQNEFKEILESSRDYFEDLNLYLLKDNQSLIINFFSDLYFDMYKKDLSEFTNLESLLIDEGAYENLLGVDVFGHLSEIVLPGLVGEKTYLLLEVPKTEFLKDMHYGRTYTLSIFAILVIVSILILMSVVNKYTSALADISKQIRRLALGKISGVERLDFDTNEYKRISDDIIRMKIFLEFTKDRMTKIAKGESIKRLKLTNNSDEVGEAVNLMVERIEEIITYTNKIGNGKYDENIIPKSDDDQLSKSLNMMNNSLRNYMLQNDLSLWLNKGRNELQYNIRGKVELEELAEEIVRFIAEYTKAKLGAFYLIDYSDNTYFLVNSYGYTPNVIRGNLGEGVLGKMAFSKNIKVFGEDDHEKVICTTATSNVEYDRFVVFSCSYENNNYAIIELAYAKEIDDKIISFIDFCRSVIGVSLFTSLNQRELESLLAISKKQGKELTIKSNEMEKANRQLKKQTQILIDNEKKLQIQQEELRVTNEELEEQTSALKESEKKLQVQQEELRVTNEELEEQAKRLEIQMNKTEIANKDLRIANDKVEQASKYKSEFLANMSHELRTPLNSILILSQLLLENDQAAFSDKQKEFISTINTSGKDLLALINDILDISKVEAGKMKIDIDEMMLNQDLNDLYLRFKPIANEKNLELELKKDEKIPTIIMSDSQKIKQIVTNLLSNAMKFTKEGKITIASKLEGENIRVTVQDTGIGINKEKLQNIFDAFVQEDGKTTRKYGGTGLGLAISKKFASMLGGDLFVESTQGVGSIFTLSIPVKESSQKNIDKKVYDEKTFEKEDIVSKTNINIKEEVKENKEDNEVKNNNKITVLIVDDDPVFRSVEEEIANKRGFLVRTASSGKEAIRVANEGNIDAVILDIGLPDIDGWDVFDELKANSKTKHIPVHFISGFDEKDKALENGALGFLTKPVTKVDLENVFKSFNIQLNADVKSIVYFCHENNNDLDLENFFKENEDIVITKSSDFENISRDILDNSQLVLINLSIGKLKVRSILKKNAAKHKLPVVIYSNKNVDKDYEEEIKKYAAKIIFGKDKSKDKVAAETKLFLHRIKETSVKKDHRISKDAFKDKNILLVDDDMRNVFAVSSVLESKGVNVTIARNGQEAVDAVYKDDSLDLVIMDIMMPVMDGYEAIRKIREDGQFDDLKIIAFTAKAMKEDREKCLEVGANDYIAKPIEIEKLVSLLRVWLYE